MRKSSQKTSPAAKFLMAIVIVIFSVFAGFLWLGSNELKAMRIAFIPNHAFSDDTQDQAPNYQKADYWYAHPNLKPEMTLALPDGTKNNTQTKASVFFMHPTTYVSRNHWNAPWDSAAANQRLQALVVKHQANAFNQDADIYLPRYRQMTFGAFLTDKDQITDTYHAADIAYQDLVTAFQHFIKDMNAAHGKDHPFILAGHSQGSFHMIRLLYEHISGTPLAARLVAAYPLGWAVSLEADVAPMTDIHACGFPKDTRCLVAFQTFGPNGDGSLLQEYFNGSVGPSGVPRQATKMLCVNPVNWQIDGEATLSKHLGALPLMMGVDDPIGRVTKGYLDTKCTQDGLLMLGQTPAQDWQDYKMFGENYHLYDINFFWANIRVNVSERIEAWHTLNNQQIKAN